MKVIGAKVSTGEYKGNNYCNVMIYGTYPIKDGEGVGVAVTSEKVKHSVLCEILGEKAITQAVIQKRLIGKNLGFAYNKYQQVTYITEMPEETAG